MLTRKMMFSLSALKYVNRLKQPSRNVQVSIIGAASDVGSNLAMLLKHNVKVDRLKLYDNDPKVRGIAIELNQIPGGPTVIGFVGDEELKASITFSKLILMVNRTTRPDGVSMQEMLSINAPTVHKLCKAMSERTPDAFLGISSNPINGLLPFASALLFKYHVYNPFRVFGITNIDSARTKSYTANVLRANPRHLSIPVIGGHSENTIVPLFSNMTPQFYGVDAKEADILTRMVNKAGAEVLTDRNGKYTATLAMAWSINEFAEKLVEAISSREVEVHAFTANPHFGTRFFSGPTTVGPYGIVRTSCMFSMSNLECNLLSDAVPKINEDIYQGEELSRRFE